MRLLAALFVLVAARADAQRVPGWEVRVPERVELTVGTPGVLLIAIAVDRGLTISKDAPVIVDLSPPQGVSVRKARLGRRDAVDPEADAPRFAVQLRPTTAGEHTIKLRLRMWLCGGRSCRPLDVRKQAILQVSEPAPAPPPDAGVDASPRR